MKETKFFFLTSKNATRILYVSLLQGWGFINLNKHQSLSPFLLHKFEKRLIANKLFGYYKSYCQFIKLKGMGYKFVLVSKGICLRIGFSHRILYLVLPDIKLKYLNKQSIVLKSRNLFSLKGLFHKLSSIKKVDVYKKKGLYIKGSLLKTKESSKKGKF